MKFGLWRANATRQPTVTGNFELAKLVPGQVQTDLEKRLHEILKDFPDITSITLTEVNKGAFFIRGEPEG